MTAEPATSTPQHGLEVSFGPYTKYRFVSASPGHSYAEVTVVDEKAPGPGVTLDGIPLVSNYEGAHCIYRGYMEQFESLGGTRLLSFREVALKWVVGAERMQGARREAGLYAKELLPLQGTIVPSFYGFFTGVIGNVEVACTVLEWCSGPPIKNLCELNRQRMLAVIALHKAGVRHGSVLDQAHYIPMGDGTLRMVGFSSGESHRCGGGTILSRTGKCDKEEDDGCEELAVMESRFGVDSDRMGTQVRHANGIFPEFNPGFFYEY